MNTRKINGLHMENMLRNGLNYLRMNEEKLNNLNVFPVADGDTGANMCVTLESGIRAAKSTNAMGAYLKTLSTAMLYGARGNSGVILSQIFRGIFKALSRCGSAGAIELRTAFIVGYKTAYEAVVRPVEGTMLTVAREGIENARRHIERSSTVEDMLGIYLNEMRRSLARTPEFLPQLREAGVVDSGALGYIFIVEGMLKYLNGEIILGNSEPAQKTDDRIITDVSLFNEKTVFASGYCVEFVLQLMNGRQYTQYFNIERFKNDLEDFGGSMVVVQNGKRIKVHIHTFKPAKVLALAQEFGEFVTCKVENMQLQYNSIEQERPASERKRKDFAVLSVADGEKMSTLFYGLGCDCVITGGAKMSASVQDFLDAVSEVNADRVAILPNDAKLIRAAQQAGELCKNSAITVIPTETVAQGYCALAMDVPDETDCEARIKHLRQGMKGVAVLSVVRTENEFSGGDAPDAVAMYNGAPLYADVNTEDAFVKGLLSIPHIADMETCIVFRGRECSELLEGTLISCLSDVLPELEVSFICSDSEQYILSAAIS